MNIKNVTSNNEETKEKNYVCTAVPFDLGKVVCTQGIAELLNNNIGVNLPIYLHRHQNGDWGNVCVEDKLTNDKPPRQASGFYPVTPFVMNKSG